VKKQFIFLLFIGFFCIPSWAQTTDVGVNTPELQVSLITCGPGAELYAKFGHSALRIKDESTGLDVIYNYGLFDFNAPNFYLNFAKGKLRYFLGKHETSGFIQAFTQEGRWVREQVLDIDQATSYQLLQRLEQNYRPENRFYLYDFFYANCATKIRDLLLDVSQGALVYPLAQEYSKKSYRELIAENLPLNSWGGWGIDLALGSMIDQPTSNFQAQFLPEYAAQQLSTALWNDRSAVRQDRYLAEPELTSPTPGIHLLGPFTLGLLLILIVWFTRTKITSQRFTCGLLHTLSGAVGVVLMLLWVATDHQTTAWNAHLFWAQPWLVFSPFWINKKRVQRTLNILVLLGISICLVIWVLGIQSFHWMMLPIWCALGMSQILMLKSNP
jgi:hypothetical protein